MCSNKLAFRLKEQIEALRGGVTAAATHLGKSRNTIYNWIEKGNAPIDQLEKLGEIGIDILYVLTGTHKSVLNPATTNEINESSLNYNRTLELKLESIVERHIHDDITMIVLDKIKQALDSKNLSISENKKPALTSAAKNGYIKLVATNRTENFETLLDLLIEAALNEEINE